MLPVDKDGTSRTAIYLLPPYHHQTPVNDRKEQRKVSINEGKEKRRHHGKTAQQNPCTAVMRKGDGLSSVRETVSVGPHRGELQIRMELG